MFCGETVSAASSANTPRSHRVTLFPVPMRIGERCGMDPEIRLLPRQRASSTMRSRRSCCPMRPDSTSQSPAPVTAIEGPTFPEELAEEASMIPASFWQWLLVSKPPDTSTSGLRRQNNPLWTDSHGPAIVAGKPSRRIQVCRPNAKLGRVREHKRWSDSIWIRSWSRSTLAESSVRELTCSGHLYSMAIRHTHTAGPYRAAVGGENFDGATKTDSSLLSRCHTIA